MLIIKQYNLLQETIIFNVFKDEYIQVDIDDEYVIFYYRKDELQYELSKNLVLTNKEETSDRHLVFTLSNQYNPCDLYICSSDDKINVFNKYSNKKDYITIGNSIDNDIYIVDDLILERHLILDIKNKQIINTNSIHAYINNKRRYKHHLKNGDLIQLLNLKIIYNDDFIMVNCCLNIHVNLDMYKSINSKQLEVTNTNIIYKGFRYYKDYEFKKFYVPKSLPIYNVNQNPLIFSIGPALTMSLASLTSSSFSIYNSYQQGKDIIESIPLLILPLVMLISTLIWNPLQNKFEKRKSIKYEKNRVEQFRKDLEIVKKEILIEQEKYKEFLNKNYFDVLNLNIENKSLRNYIWQKQNFQNDFLVFSIGKGKIKSPFVLENKYDLDSKLDTLLKETFNDIDNIDDINILVNLNEIKHLSIICKNNNLYLMYILLQICMYHCYTQINIALLCTENYLRENIDLCLLPHFIKNNVRLVATNQSQVSLINNEILNSKTIVIIQDLNLCKYLNIEGIYTINLCNDVSMVPSFSKAMILADQYSGMYLNEKNESIKYKVNNLYDLKHKTIIYKLSNCRLSNNNYFSSVETLTFFDINNIKSINELNILENWSKSFDQNNLKIKLGKTSTNNDIYLDIHENGNGPHGLVAGMTGSGKSELLITLLLSLAINFSPKILQMVILDFKGGGIIQNFKNDNYSLPHLIGALSNLQSSDLRRSLVSFKQELLKRQTLFNKMSNLYNIPNVNIDIYQRNFNEEDGLPLLASLLIVVDEFAELKKQEPDFMSELISISRIGRSLGIHLILSTQKPSGIVDDQIWSNCRFKICLKVQDKQDSFEMLHINDGASLKQLGSFYLLYDDILEKGQCAYSNAYANQDEIKKVSILDSTKQVIKETKTKIKTGKTQLNLVIDLIDKVSKQQNYIIDSLWLDKLQDVSFNSFDKDKFYLGMIDDYYLRRQIPLVYEKSSLSVFCIDSKEKRNFVYSLVFSILNIVTKFDSEMYIIDGLHCDLKMFYKIPALIDVLEMKNIEKINNLFNKATNIIENNIQDKSMYIIITHYPQFKEKFEHLKEKFRLILQDGKEYNIYLILLTTTYNTLTYQEHALISQKLCLTINNFSEIMSIFEMNQKINQTKKGYGLIKTDNILEFKVCYPTNEEIINLVKEKIEAEKEDKLYSLPFIPNKLSIDFYNGSNIPLGINVDTYEWIEYTKELILTGLYFDLVNEFKNILENRYNIKIDSCKVDSLNNVLKQENKTILWIGPGYIKQYILPIKQKDDLNEDEGIYFKIGKISKIRLVS